MPPQNGQMNNMGWNQGPPRPMGAPNFGNNMNQPPMNQNFNQMPPRFRLKKIIIAKQYLLNFIGLNHEFYKKYSSFQDLQFKINKLIIQSLQTKLERSLEKVEKISLQLNIRLGVR